MALRSTLARGLIVVLSTAVVACGSDERQHDAERPTPEGAQARLEAHSAEFEKRVYRVAEGVHQAVGFGLANSILVEGDACVFVVDVMGTVESAREVREAFREITPKPIEALIYTHNHADHVFGGRGFVPEGEGEVDVYAHDTTQYYIDRVVNIIRPIISARSTRMFGNELPTSGPDRFVNAGIGPVLEIGAEGGSTLGLIRPNRTFADVLEVEICGVEVVLVHAPGETNDQIFVWLPERRVLMPGDNVYKAFPNLYTIRGTLYRDVLEWAKSIDKMRALEPEHMAPSHSRPVSGVEQIAGILTAYRDAIQYVHDQTIRGMNQGLTPDELVEAIELPPHLASHPYLQEFYGTVDWSVRSIFDGYLGWFDGDTATLEPASPDERARGFVELAGGEEALLAAAESALEQERFAWAAELASRLMRANPSRGDARALKAQALRALGRRSTSPNGRNYYITQARELEGEVDLTRDPTVDESMLALALSIPIRNFMSAMPTNLDPEKSADVDTVVGFRFPDVDEGYTIHVRRGVAEFQPSFPESPDLSFSVDSTTWKKIVLGQRNPAVAFASGDVEITGGTVEALLFLRLFQP